MKPNQCRDTAVSNSRLARLLDFPVDDHAEWLRHKREDTAIALTGMLAACSLSRAEVSRKLNWKPSRVTRALSGNENLTINTLAEIVGAAGMDFDIMLRDRSQCRSLQPWEGANLSVVILDLHGQVIDSLTDAKDTVVQAKAVLSTANDLARAAFRQASHWRSQHAQPKKPSVSIQYCEDDYAPIARTA